jgi:hypothetical protein
MNQSWRDSVRRFKPDAQNTITENNRIIDVTREFNHNMDEIGNSLKDLTEDNID